MPQQLYKAGHWPHFANEENEAQGVKKFVQEHTQLGTANPGIRTQECTALKSQVACGVTEGFDNHNLKYLEWTSVQRGKATKVGRERGKKISFVVVQHLAASQLFFL